MSYQKIYKTVYKSMANNLYITNISIIFRTLIQALGKVTAIIKGVYDCKSHHSIR